MAWVIERRGGYRVALTDGYKGPRPTGGLRHERSEQEIADRLYRLGRGLHLNSEQRAAGGLPEFLDVWVVDPRKATAEDPEAVSLLTEGDSNPSYRFILFGTRMPTGYTHLRGDWGRWVRESGIAWRKKHAREATWHRGAGRLVESMLDWYEACQGTPPPIGRGIGVAYRGDSLDNLDSPSPRLIQQ